MSGRSILDRQQLLRGDTYGHSTAGQTIRKLVKDGFVIKKPVKIHSRARVTRRLESKRKGRYQGMGTLAARFLSGLEDAVMALFDR